MTQAPQRRKKRVLRKGAIGCLVRQVQIALFCVVAAVAVLVALTVARRGGWSLASATPSSVTSGSTTTTVVLTPTVPTATRTPRPPRATAMASATTTPKRVGILIGHTGPEKDPGAVCPDGRKEVDINLSVGEKVIAALRRKGYQVDQLEEWDDRLDGYVADAFLSIHTDSCEIPGASGFKVARAAASAIPDIEDRLVECLETGYGLATGLGLHSDSITRDMHGYHAFLKIAPRTPGAIIELGFMLDDRDLLDKQPQRLADGIAAGLVCFLENEP